MRRLTSSGRDTGVAPTREAHLAVLVKERDMRDLDIAGIRKSGRQTIDLDETAMTPFKFLVAAIAGTMVPWKVVNGSLRIPHPISYLKVQRYSVPCRMIFIHVTWLPWRDLIAGRHLHRTSL